MKDIVYSREAIRSLQRMPTNVASTIKLKIDQLAADPHSLANNVTPLKGQPGQYRLRVGDWRVIFTDDGRILGILRIAPRQSAYQ